MPDWFTAASTDARFWAGWCADDDDRTWDGPRPEALEWWFEIDPDHALVLRADPSLWRVELAIQTPADAEAVMVGWDDDAQWHPDVLRWSELEAIGRALSQDPGWPHPGPALLLLCRFAPICTDGDAEIAVGMLEAAWRTVPGMSEGAITRSIERLDHRADGFSWRETGQGFAIEQPDPEGTSGRLHTLRSPDHEEFPWQGMRSLVSAAERRAAAIAPESWPATRVLRARHQLVLTIEGESGMLWRDLDAALRDADLGSASPGGARLRREGSAPVRYITEESSVHLVIRGDVERCLPVIRALVGELGMEVRLDEVVGSERTRLTL